MSSAVDATIKMLLRDFHETVLPAIGEMLVPRDLSLGRIPEPAIGNAAKTITGMRRCGKTFRLYQEALSLLERGVEPSRICYFNFDDDRVRPYEKGIIGRVLELFFELHPHARSQGAYVLFDEIQDVDEWGVTARRLIDTEKITLLLTGSSSRLLSEDVATEFRGRSVAYELAPFSLREHARSRGIDLSPVGVSGNKELASHAKRMLLDYLKVGGFPAAGKLDDLERAQTLQGYAQLTVARDIVDRLGFSNSSYAQQLARTAVTSTARDVSINRLDHKGRSSGYTPGRARIAELLDAFDNAHLAYQVYEFSYSAQKLRMGGMKLYAVDPGLYWAMAAATDDGTTFAFETAVYGELRRRRMTARLGEISMLKLESGKEVDFVVGDATTESAQMLVQACFAMDDAKTEARETEALREAMARFGTGEGVIVTFDEERDIEVPEGVIRVVPAWKWLLGG